MHNYDVLALGKGVLHERGHGVQGVQWRLLERNGCMTDVWAHLHGIGIFCTIIYIGFG